MSLPPRAIADRAVAAHRERRLPGDRVVVDLAGTGQSSSVALSSQR
jgi:hypothetical protein